MTALQLALDGDMSSALDILERVHPFIGIAEVGTPLVFREGMNAQSAKSALLFQSSRS